MVRQANRIEKALDSSLNQFNDAPLVGHGLTDLAFCEIDGLVCDPLNAR
jgi:hypothetical protein